MSELAHLLGVTKDVIKYQRKQFLAEVVSKNEQGIVMISEDEAEIIRGKLRKDDYSGNFKNATLRHFEALRNEFDPSKRIFRSL